MTSPPTQARTANEQRIAALEAQLVTMRGALEQTACHASDVTPCFNSCPRCAALASTDFAGKVVVDRELIKTLFMNVRGVKSCCHCAVDDLEKSARSETVGMATRAIRSAFPNLDFVLARLDALREGGKG